MQRVSLRTKIVVPIVVLAVAPALVIAIIALLQIQESLEGSAAQRVTFETASKARAVEDFLQTVQQDLRFLSELDAVRALANLDAAEAFDQLSLRRKEVEESFIVFSQGKRAYYQVRYLNSVGHEVVRLDVANGRPRAVSAPQLQDKSQRYYVTNALTLDPGQIYVSPFDLNVERGEVETPQRVVVRYATPVSGVAGGGRGLLVINLYANYLLSLMGPLPSGTEAWLVDEQRVYVGYVGESEAKQDAYSFERKRPLAFDYSSEDVATLLQTGSRRATIRTADAILSHAAIGFDAGAPDRSWSLIVSQPRVPIDAPIRSVRRFLSAGVAAILAIAGALGVLLARYVARPVEILRQATREIAGGDLSKRVRITTGDEIEELAVDFNEMTERLREAQERLSGWNEELEREVTQRTNELRRLQQGLARADKLASIGQMTAGVMHEIGNPLAAIKTKIQVAEEEDTLDANSRAILSEILEEVDRLAVFLRSFSRLSRLRTPQLEDVSLAEVVQSVAALVGPEIERRGVSLHVEAPADVPVIRGDVDQLHQLLINLLLNAAEAYTGHGEIVIKAQRMDPALEEGGSTAMARLEIIDRGAGMSPAVINKIWDPFYTTKSEGTGLGLAICRTIVQDHGGTIEVRSEPGKGTIVTLTFPALSSEA